MQRWKREFEAEASGDRLNSDEWGELQRLRKESQSRRKRARTVEAFSMHAPFD